MKKMLVAMVLGLVSFGAFAAGTSTTQTMKFDTCKDYVARSIAEPGAEFKVYKDTKEEKTVQFAKPSGSVTISCVSKGNKMVTTQN